MATPTVGSAAVPDAAPGRSADRTRPALALSGGGFRATLYHAGVLIRLNELGLLGGLERISCVSGGSIAGGMLAKAWPELDFRDGTARQLGAKVIEPLRAFCRLSVDKAAVGWGLLNPFTSIGEVLADSYDEHLFGGTTLDQLVEVPQFVFMATNLQTGRAVRLSKRRIADYTIGEIPHPTERLAVAVAASSAFPPVLSPVRVPVDPARWRDLPGTRHFGDPDYTSELVLTDGGAYDNLGLETVDDFATLLISDAGAPFGIQDEGQDGWTKQAMRALDIATDQSRGLRKRLIFAQAQAAPARKVAYFGIDGDPGEYGVAARLPTRKGVGEALAKIRTRLDPFSDDEQGRLINWGYAMSDAAVRRFVMPAAPAPTAWPCPAQALG